MVSGNISSMNKLTQIIFVFTTTITAYGQISESVRIELSSIPDSSILQEDGYYIWGATMIKGDDSLYHVFYSRWPDSLGFNAWVTHSEIAHAVSKSMFGPYQFYGIALNKRASDFWDGLCTHNPTIHKFNGKYYLYYMGNTGDGVNTKGYNFSHRNNQRIGVAISDSPYGPWERTNSPLIDVSKDKDAPDALCVSNPSIVKTSDDKYLLIYKAVGLKNKLPFGGPVVHLTALSDNPDGPFLKNTNPIFTTKNSDFPVEDPYLFYHGNLYYAILKDMGGYFNPNGKSLILFKSKDGMNWDLSNHFEVSTLTLEFAGGEIKKVDRLERPQLYIDSKTGLGVLFLAVKEGHKTYNVHIPAEIIGK
jgi:predicted GH43/DUF377 family glycosyl hydrolase